MTPPKTHLQINSDLAGWWIVNHPEAKDRHAVADPCPLNDLQCKLDRKAVNRLMVRHGSWSPEDSA